EERELVPGQQVAAEPEPEHQEEEQNAADPGQLSRLSIRFQNEDAEEVCEGQTNQQIRRPAVDVANQPAELHLRDDELDTLIRFAGARTIVEQQQNAGEDLHRE